MRPAVQFRCGIASCSAGATAEGATSADPVNLTGLVNRVQIDVLGPFRLTVDGAECSVSRPQVRSVLAYLSTTDGSVPVDDLADMLWPTDLPADPVAVLRTVLSRTREALGDAQGALQGDGHRYSIDARSDSGR